MSKRLAPRPLASRRDCRAAQAAQAPSFESSWRGSRTWIGKEYWANPLQDWRVEDGEVIAQAAAGRTLHLLTHQVTPSGGGFHLQATIRLVSPSAGGEKVARTWGPASFSVFAVAWRDISTHWFIPSLRWLLGCAATGRLFCGGTVGGSVPLDFPGALDAERPERRARLTKPSCLRSPPREARQHKSRRPSDHPSCQATLHWPRKRPAGPGLKPAEWNGASAIGSSGGTKLAAHPDQTFGPILWTQYTLSRETLKLAAHFPPLGDEDEWTARLQTRRGTRWATIASAAIERLSRAAIFRVDGWDASRDAEYRVAYAFQGEEHHWGGVVRKDPREKERLRIGVFSCDHGEVFPQRRLVRNIRLQDPDIAFFAGDQIYEGYGGFGVARGKPSEEAMLDYLRKYWQFGWTWRSILKDRPSIIIPDDHDVFQGNIWGQAGRALPRSAEGPGFERGGFLMEVDWVNAVQRTQSGHLPDPVDPAPCQSGIEVYFTELRYGSASIAILEDRKFKTGPADILSPEQRAAGRTDPAVVDIEGAELLGRRQESFLKNWSRDSVDADFRLVCSQTIFCKATTHAGGRLQRRLIDLDCGGWPQAARNRALAILQAAGNVIMLHGDQHIGSLLRHGIEEWEDGPIAFMAPGTSNGFPRAWWPDQPGQNRDPSAPAWTGPLSRRAGQPDHSSGRGQPRQEQQYEGGPGRTDCRGNRSPQGLGSRHRDLGSKGNDGQFRNLEACVRRGPASSARPLSRVSDRRATTGLAGASSGSPGRLWHHRVTSPRPVTGQVIGGNRGTADKSAVVLRRRTPQCTPNCVARLERIVR